MLSTSQFNKENPETFSLFSSFVLKNPIFPCIHAKVSLQKELMYFGISEGSKVDIHKLATDLSEMASFLDSAREDDEMSFNTYVHIMLNHYVTDVTLFLLNLLQSLHNLDQLSWPDSKTKDMNSQDFTFYFNEISWVPILLSANHPTKIRRAPFTVVAFQPGITFDYNKKNKTNRYNKIRNLTHEKIDDIYGDSRPFYLSSRSSGKNIVQYVGIDEAEFNQDYTYPKLFSHI